MEHVCIRRLDVPASSDNIINLQVDIESSIYNIRLQIASLLNLDPAVLLLTQLASGEQIMLADNYKVNLLEGNTKVIFLEVSNDSEIKVKTKINSNELEIAEQPSTKDWLGMLIEKCKQGSLSGFLQVISECEKEDSSLLHDEEDDLLSRRGLDGWTLLHFACQTGHANIVQLLVSRHACCNKESDDQWTPLQLATHYGHLECNAYFRCEVSAETSPHSAEQTYRVKRHSFAYSKQTWLYSDRDFTTRKSGIYEVNSIQNRRSDRQDSS